MSRTRLTGVALGCFLLVALSVAATFVFALGPATAAAVPLPPGRALVHATVGSTPARKIKDVPAIYPESAQQARVEGLVVLEINVNERGSVSEARVIQSAPLLDQAALDAVVQWGYEPATLDGRPVPTILVVTLRFSLSNDSSR